MAGCCLGPGSPLGTLGTVRGCTPGTVFNNSPIRDTSDISPPALLGPQIPNLGVFGGSIEMCGFNMGILPKTSILEVSPRIWGGTEIRTPGGTEQIRPAGPRDPQGAPGALGDPPNRRPCVPHRDHQIDRFRAFWGPQCPPKTLRLWQDYEGGSSRPPLRYACAICDLLPVSTLTFSIAGHWRGACHVRGRLR